MVEVQVSGEDWKERYREVVDELAAAEQELATLKELLPRAVTRLSMAAMGCNLDLDERLTRIRRLLVDDEDWARAGEELDELAKELVATDRSEPIAVPDMSAGVSADLVQSWVERLAAVPALEQSLGDVRTRLGQRIGSDDWAGVLDRLADVVAGTVTSIQSQKADLEGFLDEVTNELAAFEALAQWNTHEANESRSSSDGLTVSIRNEIDELNSDVEQSDDGDDLKRRVRQRLDSVAARLVEFRTNEEKRVRRIEEKNGELAERVRKLSATTQSLAAAYSEQHGQLMRDTLTGIHSRFAYEQRLDEELARARRHEQPLCYVLWDIDNFKTVNDSYGHRAGDRVLKIVAGLLAGGTRKEDFVARLGGEEFAMLLPETTADEAVKLAEKLRETIAGTGFHYRGEPRPITISAGVTAARSDDAAAVIYERADQALYEAKSSGRNRVVSR